MHTIVNTQKVFTFFYKQFKKFTIMKKINYSETQLTTHFTMSELMDISIALASESFSELNKGRNCNAERAWELRSKVLQFVDSYKTLYAVS